MQTYAVFQTLAEPMTAPAFPRCTATAILCRRNWCEWGSLVTVSTRRASSRRNSLALWLTYTKKHPLNCEHPRIPYMLWRAHVM